MVPVRTGISIPNSLAFSPDGRTMYFADSLRYAIFAHDYDLATGTMGAERVFAASEAPAFADGSAVDAEGFLWNAQFNGGQLVRYAPDGRIDRVLPLPVQRPTLIGVWTGTRKQNASMEAKVMGCVFMFVLMWRPGWLR